MQPKKYSQLTGNTDHEKYNEVADRIVKHQDDVVNLLIEILALGIKTDMLKKVIAYGLEVGSADYNAKFQKHIDALVNIKMGKISKDVISSEKFARLFHYYVGISAESSETIEALLNWATGIKELDHVNCSEEHGDLLWFMDRANSVIDGNIPDQMNTNIKKLAARYPNKFTKEAALNRDLSKERKLLEKGHNQKKKKK